MKEYSDLISRLIKELSKFPGIGPRSAERMVFFLLKSPEIFSEQLAHLISQTRQRSRFCRDCYQLAYAEVCDICLDASRDSTQLCVVEDPKDVFFLEKSGGYKGLYHVLLGALSPLDGIGPNELRIHELVTRVRKLGVNEVILATNSNTEGETTALYLNRILKDSGVKITRIARGLPVGSNLEYVDPATLHHAMHSRVELQS